MIIPEGMRAKREVKREKRKGGERIKNIIVASQTLFKQGGVK